MNEHPTINIFWFRRDLRFHDNHALFEALNSGFPVLPIFVFDTHILKNSANKKDLRLIFIHQQLLRLKSEFEKRGSSLLMLYGNAEEVFRDLFTRFRINAIYTNHDYEPYARERDERIMKIAGQHHICFYSFKDQLVFEKDEILKKDGKPYTVFTPYSRRWKECINNEALPGFPSENDTDHLYKTAPFPVIGLEEMGFVQAPAVFPEIDLSDRMFLQYAKTRDFPAPDSTSKAGLHLRFGTVSIRQVVKKALEKSEIYLNELIWREFFMQILWHFPHVVHLSFRSKYDHIQWRNNEHEFEAWCRGETGYPIVDAGMRQLNESGFMHNRVRMITASFLTKHLLVDWRWGEAYFASLLLDYELSSNNGNWQWAAGTGCDAAPYFRIFNPGAQALKFDPEKTYIYKWIPDYKCDHYLPPIADHGFARQRALETYKKALFH